jgi:hypothetical protein
MQRLSYFLRIPHVSHAGGLLVSAAWFAAQTEFGNRNKNARLRGHSYFLAETEGFAYVPQAAESLASDSLRIPRVSHAGGLLVSTAWFAAQTESGIEIKMPACAGIRISWRRRRDSNPRYRFKPICFLSREVPSTTRPRLHTAGNQLLASVKSRIISFHTALVNNTMQFR